MIRALTSMVVLLIWTISAYQDRVIHVFQTVQTRARRQNRQRNTILEIQAS